MKCAIPKCRTRCHWVSMFFSRRCLGKSRTVRPSVSEANVKRDTTAMYHLIATNKFNMQSRAAQQGGKGSQQLEWRERVTRGYLGPEAES